MSGPRRLGRPHRCPRCGAGMVWARTLAGENGPGGKAMPLDPLEDPAGNVAARVSATGATPIARVLKKGECHDVVAEVRAMPHFATCKPPEPISATAQPGVVDMDAFRRRKAER